MEDQINKKTFNMDMKEVQFSSFSKSLSNCIKQVKIEDNNQNLL